MSCPTMRKMRRRSIAEVEAPAVLRVANVSRVLEESFYSLTSSFDDGQGGLHATLADIEGSAACNGCRSA